MHGDNFCEEIGEAASELKEKYRSWRAKDAKSVCELKIDQYIKLTPRKENEFDFWNQKSDKDLFSEIYGFYDSCNPKDKESILTHLQSRVDHLGKEIKELRDGTKTIKFCLFKPKMTKEERIKKDEAQKGRAEDLQKFFVEKKNTLRIN